MTALWWTLSGFFVAIGLCIGSFLNVAIARLPEDRSLLPGSACPTCATPIRPWQNIPLVSYLALRGACSTCAAPIPASYPVIEALGGALGFLAWARCVPVGAVDLPHVAAALALLVFLGALVAAAQIDVRHQILPDELTIYAAPVAIAVVAGLDAVGVQSFPFPGWESAVRGAAFAGLGMTALRVTFGFLLRREGLGWGDVKLMAMIGGFLGAFPGAFLTLLGGTFVGSILGLLHLLVTRRRSYLPLGPCLAWSAAFYALFGDVVTPIVFPGIPLAGGW